MVKKPDHECSDFEGCAVGIVRCLGTSTLFDFQREGVSHGTVLVTIPECPSCPENERCVHERVQMGYFLLRALRSLSLEP